MLPLSWLKSRSSCCRLMRLPEFVGILPLSSFWARSRTLNWVRLPKLDGMLPLSWLPLSRRDSTEPRTLTQPFVYCTPSTVTPYQLAAFGLSQPFVLLHPDPPADSYKFVNAEYSADGIW